METLAVSLISLRAYVQFWTLNATDFLPPKQ